MLHHSEYAVVYLDDATGMHFIYFMKHKNEQIHCFKQFMGVMNSHGCKITEFRCDGGKGEYLNKDFTELLQQHSIRRTHSAPNTPQNNARAEAVWNHLQYHREG